MKALIDVTTPEGIQKVITLIEGYLHVIWAEFLDSGIVDPHKYANEYVEFFNLTGEHDLYTGDPLPMFNDVPVAYRIILDRIVLDIMERGWIPVFDTKDGTELSTLLSPNPPTNPDWLDKHCTNRHLTTQIYPDILDKVKSGQIKRFFLSEDDWEIMALDNDGQEYKTDIFWNVDGSSDCRDHTRFEPKELTRESVLAFFENAPYLEDVLPEVGSGQSRFVRINARMDIYNTCVFPSFDYDVETKTVEVCIYEEDGRENPLFVSDGPFDKVSDALSFVFKECN